MKRIWKCKWWTEDALGVTEEVSAIVQSKKGMGNTQAFKMAKRYIKSSKPKINFKSFDNCSAEPLDDEELLSMNHFDWSA